MDQSFGNFMKKVINSDSSNTLYNTGEPRNLRTFMKNLTPEQITAIRCALADLCGSWQAMKQGDYSIHDWESHELTIIELADLFDLEDELPRELRTDQEEYCYHCFNWHDGEVSSIDGYPESGCPDYEDESE